MTGETQFHAPLSIPDLVTLLTTHPDCHILAGGTDLLVRMRLGATIGATTGTHIVDIKRIPAMTELRLNADGLTVGAAVSAQSITERADIKALFPGLVEAIDLIGSTQIQGRCSVGGNLCNASPAADTVPALIANQAVCHITGANGARTVAAQDFSTGPGQNCLASGEVLTALFIPTPAARTADAYLRFIPRTEMDIAVVGAAVAITLDDGGVCSAARVWIGAVAPTALLVPAAAQALIGTRLDAASLEQAAAAVSAAASPISDKRGTAEFRRKVVGVLTRRAATIAMTRALTPLKERR